MAEPIIVKAVVAGPHRLDMLNASTGARVGKINVRPRLAANISEAGMHASVLMFCELMNLMHDPHTFVAQDSTADAAARETERLAATEREFTTALREVAS